MKSLSDGLSAAAVVVVLAFAPGCAARQAPASSPPPEVNEDAVPVKVLSPQKTTLRRTATQPATVLPYYQAEICARASGYLKQLNVDIGDEVEPGAVLAEIDVPETVKSRERQQATIERLKAEEGRAAAELKVGQAKVRAAQAALDQARADVGGVEAQLTATRLEFNRVGELVKGKAVADRLLDEASKHYEVSQAAESSAQAAVVGGEANLAVAQAEQQAAEASVTTARAETEVARKELEEIDTQLAYATLRAPFQGVVTERHVDPGDLVRATPSPGRDCPALFVISSLGKVRVRVPLPERDAPWANVGDAATLMVPALPDREFSGRISRVSSGLDPESRTMSVEIDLDNADHLLLPGMFGTATVVLEERKDRLVLPASAVRHDESGRSYVYLVDDESQVRPVDVTTGADDGQTIEIVGGLAGGERVVDARIGVLRPVQKVRIENEE